MKMPSTIAPAPAAAPAPSLPPYRPDWIRIGAGLVDLNAARDFAAVLPKASQLEGPSAALMLGRAGW